MRISCSSGAKMGDSSLSVKTLADQLLENSCLDHALTMVFDDVSFRIKCNDAAIVEALSDYFAQFVSDVASVDIELMAVQTEPPEIDADFTPQLRESPEKRIKEEYVDTPDGRIIRKTLTRMTYLLGGNLNVVLGDCLSNLNQLVNFINNRFIEWHLQRDAILFHAAGVAHEGWGLALAGFSGMGKSTLALHLMSSGLSFVSNDRLLVSRANAGLDMRGVAKLPRVNPGTILHNANLHSLIDDKERSRLAAMDQQTLWSLEQKYDVYLKDCFLAGQQLIRSPMVALVILNWHHTDEPTRAEKVSLADRPDLMPAFMKSPGLFYKPQARYSGDRATDEQRYLQRLEGCDVVEISGGIDFEAATSACLRLLGIRKPDDACCDVD